MNWLGWRRFCYFLSGLLILLGLWGILRGGLKPALEFSGGSELVVSAPVEQSQFQTALQETAQTQDAITLENLAFHNQQAVLTLNEISAEQKSIYLAAVENQLGQPVTEEKFQTVGPSVSRDLITKTAYAAGLGILSILLYLWWQFKNWRYGLAGVLAMMHDSLILLGSFAWLGLLFDVKVDLLFVTALLTTLSFSVHDTIVIFDRIRDLQRHNRQSTQLPTLINRAITQTLPRSLNNSFTIIFMLVVLLFLGGETLRWFTAALLIGTLTGTYSSTFTAVPLYFDLRKK